MAARSFRRALYVGVDIRGYASAPERRQETWQELLLRCLDRAAASAGLDRSSWIRQQKGDEELAVLPDSEPEPVVVDDFVRHLEAEVRQHNAEVLPQARLRLRLAVHHGVAVRGANGFPCRDAVILGRLLDSRPLRRALDQRPEANVALMLSDIVYRSVVEAGYTSLPADDFRRVPVREKEFRGFGWLWSPRWDRSADALDVTDAMDAGDAVGTRVDESVAPHSMPTAVRVRPYVVLGFDPPEPPRPVTARRPEIRHVILDVRRPDGRGWEN